MKRNVINYMHAEAELLLLSISSEILELLLNCTNVHLDTLQLLSISSEILELLLNCTNVHLDTLQLYMHSLLTHGWAHPRVGTEVPELLK